MSAEAALTSSYLLTVLLAGVLGLMVYAILRAPFDEIARSLPIAPWSQTLRRAFSLTALRTFGAAIAFWYLGGEHGCDGYTIQRALEQPSLVVKLDRLLVQRVMEVTAYAVLGWGALVILVLIAIRRYQADTAPAQVQPECAAT